MHTASEAETVITFIIWSVATGHDPWVRCFLALKDNFSTGVRTSFDSSTVSFGKLFGKFALVLCGVIAL